MTVSAHVSFTSTSHSQTYTITAPTSAEVDDEVTRTKNRLATLWGEEVTVTYLTN